MYNHKLIFASNIFEAGMTVPNTAAGAVAAAAGLRCGGQEGRLAVTVICKTAITLSATENFILSLQDSADNGVADAYAAIAPARTVTITAPSGGTTYAAGDEIVSMMIPRGVDKWVKPVLQTDDADIAGTVDVILEYLGN